MVDLKENIRENTITDLILTARNIKNLYDWMDVDNQTEVQEELAEQIAQENQLLEKLNITKQNSREIYEAIENALEESLFDHYRIALKDKELEAILKNYNRTKKFSLEQENDLILKRIESYIIKRIQPLPVKSTKEDKKAALVEDAATIKHQARLDYYASVIHYLDTIEGSKAEKRVAMHTRNQILFKEKELEEQYLSNWMELSRKQTCIDLGHPIEMVEDIYYDYISDNINQNGNRCFIYPNSSFDQLKERIRFQILLQLLKASLSMLNTEEVKEITMNYECTFMNSTKKSVKYIKRAMKEVIAQKESVKTIQGPIRQKKLSD